jgi:hypothetical protein
MKTILYSALFFLLSSIALGQTTQGSLYKPTKIILDDKPVPISLPSKNKQVAVLTIAFDFVDGKVQRAEKIKSQRVRSVAPKVLTRISGDWEVTIHGAKTHRFYVSNPGYREAEPHPSSNGKYEWVGITDRVEWPLVLPLYHKEESLEARSITIKDARNGEIILETVI